MLYAEHVYAVSKGELVGVRVNLDVAYLMTTGSRRS